uniref:Uncharacterized protein n=1 Tax=Sphingobacterium sp. (strain 21) TaxID=743722 RepID=F4CA25_SPHS2
MEKYAYLLENKFVKIALVGLSIYFIYRFGKSCGEFLYYITH